LQGKYFFLDAGGNNNWIANTNPFGSVTNIDSLFVPNVGSASFPVSYGEDAVGNLYVAYLGSGEVYRIATTHPAGDYDFDGDVDNGDYNIWRATVGLVSNTAPADGNGNGVVDAADYVIWRKNFGASLGSAAGVPEAGIAIYLIQLLALGSLLVQIRKRTIMSVSTTNT
jgi:hypothetical protein